MNVWLKRNGLALALGAATTGQVAVALALDGGGGGAAWQVGLLGLAAGWVVFEGWRNRMRLDHRVDMLLVMLAFGGLGMVCGTAIDLATAEGDGADAHLGHAMHDTQHAGENLTVDHAHMHQVTDEMHTDHGPADVVSDDYRSTVGMHADQMHTDDQDTDHIHTVDMPSSREAVHPAHASGHSILAGLVSWMTALMLLGGVPPTWFTTRCAELASRSWRRWISTHLLGNAGMVFGMLALGAWLGHPFGMRLGLMHTGHHLVMLFGMLVGMSAAQFVGDAALGLRPWRRFRDVEAVRADDRSATG